MQSADAKRDMIGHQFCFCSDKPKTVFAHINQFWPTCYFSKEKNLFSPDCCKIEKWKTTAVLFPLFPLKRNKGKRPGSSNRSIMKVRDPPSSSSTSTSPEPSTIFFLLPIISIPFAKKNCIVHSWTKQHTYDLESLTKLLKISKWKTLLLSGFNLIGCLFFNLQLFSFHSFILNSSLALSFLHKARTNLICFQLSMRL